MTKIVFGYTGGLDTLPAFVAKDKGFFDAHGVDVEVTRIMVTPHIPAELAAGSLNIGMSNASLLLMALDSGLDLMITTAATRYDKMRPAASLLAVPAIKSVAELKGKRIGVPGINTLIDVTFRYWAKHHGFPLDELHFVEAPLRRMSEMIQAGQVDAVGVAEPLRSRLLADGLGHVIANYFDDWDGIVQSFLMGDRCWVEAHPDAVRAFNAAWRDAVADMHAHPDDAHAIEKEYLGFASPEFSAFSNEIAPNDLTLYLLMCNELGLVKGPIDLTRVVFTP
jgi:NitT/TauT family transport system substrate-binding protein